MSVDTALKWRALAEQRRAHLSELYDSGRWKHYYSEDQLFERMREAVRLVQIWDRLSTPPSEATAIAAE